MICLSKQNAKHSVYLFPEEYLLDNTLEGKTILDKESGEKMKITCVCIIKKEEPFPSGWLFILTGRYFDSDVFEKYPKSDRLFCVSCDKI